MEREACTVDVPARLLGLSLGMGESYTLAPGVGAEHTHPVLAHQYIILDPYRVPVAAFFGGCSPASHLVIEHNDVIVYTSRRAVRMRRHDHRGVRRETARKLGAHRVRTLHIDGAVGIQLVACPRLDDQHGLISPPPCRGPEQGASLVDPRQRGMTIVPRRTHPDDAQRGRAHLAFTRSPAGAVHSVDPGGSNVLCPIHRHDGHCRSPPPRVRPALRRARRAAR